MQPETLSWNKQNYISFSTQLHISIYVMTKNETPNKNQTLRALSLLFVTVIERSRDAVLPR